MTTVLANDAPTAAQQILELHEQNAQFQPLTRSAGPLSLVDAYAIQVQLVQALQARDGGTPIGYKVGLTSRTMQEMCGIAHPIYGVVLASRVVASGSALPLQAFGRLGVEFEIALRLGVDVDAGIDVDQIAGCVDGVCLAMELVDDRRADYAVIDAASLVADNSWNAGAVFGAWVAPDDELLAAVATVHIDRQPKFSTVIGESGTRPFEVLHWLVQALAQVGRTLKKGDCVLTGSVVQTVFPEPGQHIRYEVSGMAPITLSVR